MIILEIYLKKEKESPDLDYLPHKNETKPSTENVWGTKLQDK
jgi:hypothetical protein